MTIIHLQNTLSILQQYAHTAVRSTQKEPQLEGKISNVPPNVPFNYT